MTGNKDENNYVSDSLQKAFDIIDKNKTNNKNGHKDLLCKDISKTKAKTNQKNNKSFSSLAALLGEENISQNINPSNPSNKVNNYNINIHDDVNNKATDTTKEDVMAKKRKKKKTRLTVFSKFLIGLLVFLIVTAFGLFWGYSYLMSDLEHNELDPNVNLGINSDIYNNLTHTEKKVVNIALFGIDSEVSMEGRSDAIMVLSLDNVNGKIKIISIARDTYVPIEGHGKTKLNHAYSYGGPELAIHTLNSVFHLNISEYVTVNFSRIEQIIDAVGGVEVEATASEIESVNALMEHEGSYNFIEGSGTVYLDGEQALAFSRERYESGGDGARTDRQRRILEALLKKALKMNVTEYPNFIKTIMPLCETSLSSTEILGHTPILLTKDLSLMMDSIPNEYIEYDSQLLDLWYYMYDTEEAASMIYDFLYKDLTFEEQYNLTLEDTDTTEE